MGKDRASYKIKFKLQVVQYAHENGKKAAARKFNVDGKNVRRWCQQRDNLQQAGPKKCSLRTQHCKYPQVEEELYQYVLATRKNGFAVTTEMLLFEASKIARQRNIPANEFKASYGWLRRFMARKDLSIRRRTSIAQKLPESFEKKLLDFQRFVINLRRQNQYQLGQIGNADQTPVYFDMPEATTVTPSGARSVKILGTGADKQRCTVMLCVTADGRKLPPYVVFKRKTLPKDNFPPGIIVRVQEKGWMTEELVKDWILCVWCRRPGGLLRLQSLLVLDSYRGHLTDGVKKQLKEGKSDLAVIPGGMTGMLQPLDVVINKPFKTHMRRLYSEWIRTHQETTKTGRPKRASLPEVCRWILEAWRCISAEFVTKSFKVTGISCDLDGTEDDAIWNMQDDNDGGEAVGNDSDVGSGSDVSEAGSEDESGSDYKSFIM